MVTLPVKVTISNNTTVTHTCVLDALNAALAAPEPGDSANEGEEPGLACGREEGERAEEEEEDQMAIVVPMKHKQGPYKKSV
jgi:hypothetical protein